MRLQLNRQIGYTQSWTSTAAIAAIVGGVFCFILVFLQPFDTYNVEMPFKNLKLIGYFLPVAISIMGIHVLENWWFKQSQKWHLYHEIATMILGILIITLLSFLYLNHVVNPKPVPWNEFFIWFRNFGLPFSPIVLVLWLYLRFRFSTIDLGSNPSDADKAYEIEGDNSNEKYRFKWNDFLMARSQSNYVEIVLMEKDTLQKTLIRSTLSKLISQLPDALQVHRSYIINSAHLEKLEGNARKGWCKLKGLDEQVPVSPKHFKALKSRVQIHP